MSKVKTLSGIALATSAAALFASSAVMGAEAGASASEALVHCHGVNACRERGNCRSAESKCKGQNACKGHGWVPVTAQICEQLGGVVRTD